MQMLKSEGPDASGMFEFYESRIEKNRTALSNYDRALLDYVETHFKRQDRHIVHAGTGLGTLPCALALSGYKVTGVEQDGRRFRAAQRVRLSLLDAWPDIADRYELVSGQFPGVLQGTPALGPQTVLIFTNCGAGWSDELTAHVIQTFLNLGDTILDLRLFGRVRDSEDERQRLLDTIFGKQLHGTPIKTSPAGTYYFHIQPRRYAR